MSRLIVTPLTDGNTWVLASPFRSAPLGFMTDFASIPRIFWWALPKWGVYGFAAVVHDWLYWSQLGTRYEADRRLRKLMVADHTPAWQVALIYAGVRLFGWIGWWRNQQDRANGFNRVVDIDDARPLKRPGLTYRIATCWR